MQGPYLPRVYAFHSILIPLQSAFFAPSPSHFTSPQQGARGDASGGNAQKKIPIVQTLRAPDRGGGLCITPPVQEDREKRILHPSEARASAARPVKTYTTFSDLEFLLQQRLGMVFSFYFGPRGIAFLTKGPLPSHRRRKVPGA